MPRFRDITQAGRAAMATDFLVGVTAGNVDQLFSGVNYIPATSDLTWYVATTGNDSNAGTIGSPFLTIQHAVNVAASYDYKLLYIPTINVADGTYVLTTSVVIPTIVNIKPTKFLNIVGNHTTPANCILTGQASGHGIFQVVGFFTNVFFDGFQTDTQNYSYWINGGVGSALNFNSSNLVFADSGNSGQHLPFWTPTQFSSITVISATINVTATGLFAFADIEEYSGFTCASNTITFPVGGCAMADTFLLAIDFSDVIFILNTIVNGSGVTGKRLVLTSGSVVTSDHGMIEDFPGSVITHNIDNSSILTSETVGSGGQMFGNSISAIPTSTNLSPNGFMVFKDTGGGGVYLAYNDAGTLKKVTLT